MLLECSLKEYFQCLWVGKGGKPQHPDDRLGLSVGSPPTSSAGTWQKQQEVPCDCGVTQPSLSSHSVPRGGGSGVPARPCPGPHPALVPGLGFSFAAAGDVIILGLDLGNDAVHVQLPAVVHLHNDGGLRDLRLEQADLLGGGHVGAREHFEDKSGGAEEGNSSDFPIADLHRNLQGCPESSITNLFFIPHPSPHPELHRLKNQGLGPLNSRCLTA